MRRDDVKYSPLGGIQPLTEKEADFLRTESGQNWQPVRVVSFERMREIHPSGDIAYQRSAANKIIRVCPAGFTTPHFPCDAKQSYLIHPDDAKILGWSGFDLRLCKNQILAD